MNKKSFFMTALICQVMVGLPHVWAKGPSSKMSSWEEDSGATPLTSLGQQRRILLDKFEKESIVAKHFLDKVYAQEFKKETDYNLRAVCVEALKGNAMNQFLLGTMYLMGIEVEQDDSQAIYWLNRAAAKEFPKAQLLLGILYAIGIGVKQDDKLSATLYKKAAMEGLPEALHLFAERCVKGRGIAQDLIGAIFWFMHASEEFSRRVWWDRAKL